MRLLHLLFALLFFCLAVCFIYFTQHKQSSTASTIVCTTTILADAVRNVVGDCAQVISLMGPGVDPHLYRPREGDVHKLANAQLVFYHGLHLEGKLATLLGSIDRYAPAYAVSDGIPTTALRSADDELYDPHVWFSVPLWIQVIDYIAQRCVEHDPHNANTYYQNADNYIRELVQLHSWIKAQIASIPPEHRCLVTAHDAFGYFGQTYGLEVIALQGISTESDIGMWDVQRLVNVVLTRRIPALFVETAIPHRTLQAVVDAVRVQGGTVVLGNELYTDALGDVQSHADTYISMVQHNVKTLMRGLTSGA